MTVPIHSRRSPPVGVAVRRRALSDVDIVVRLDVALVSAPLAALEAAVELGPAGPDFLDRALQWHVGFPAVYRAYCRNLGSSGSRAAGRLIMAAVDRAGSAAERQLVRLLRAGGVRGWVLSHAAEGYLLDLAFPIERVAVEVDGWAWHVDVERFRADRRRQNRLVAAGWVVLRFTWHDLVGRPDEVVAEIRSALTCANTAQPRQ